MSQTKRGSLSLETGHVGLNVSDLARSKQFYQNVLGLAVLGESRQVGKSFVFLGHEDKLVLTLWQQSQGRFDKGLPGLHHLAFEAASLEEVKEAERKLRALNIPLIYDGIVSHAEGAESGGLFFEDPDGIRLELYAPTGAGSHRPPNAEGPACGFF
ncbi:MAG: VOC family protein [Acidobacteriota bacterium]